MEAIPEAWPPEETALPVVPVFPLPSVWLYPRVLLPLNIFEPRYRQMIEDSLDGPGKVVIATIVDGHESEQPGAPPIYTVAGMGEIGRHQRLEDGTFQIVLAGQYRVRIEEIESDRLYRKVRALRLFETAPSGDSAAPLRARLQRAVRRAGVGLGPEVVDKLSLSSLADVLSAHLDVETNVKQDLFELLDAGDRARRALDAFTAARGEGDADAEE